MLSWIFCHKWALKIWMREIFSVGIFPCMKMPVRSSCTWKPTYTYKQKEDIINKPVGWFWTLKKRLFAFQSTKVKLNDLLRDVFSTASCTYIGSVDGGWPPKCEATVGDLVETRPLSIGQLFPFHGLLKATGLLPKAQKHSGCFFNELNYIWHKSVLWQG